MSVQKILTAGGLIEVRRGFFADRIKSIVATAPDRDDEGYPRRLGLISRRHLSDRLLDWLGSAGTPYELRRRALIAWLAEQLIEDEEQLSRELAEVTS